MPACSHCCSVLAKN
ncbi:hypothetical protein VCHC41A1_3014, partial [Vibrio cholerae HC-41A1]